LRSSLSFRLLLAASMSTLAALVATALVLNFLFRAYFEDRIHAELESYLVQLTANVALDANGDLDITELSDPRFAEPLSGFYWQVQLQDRAPVQSQSFWAEPLTLPRPGQRGEIVFTPAVLPEGDRILAGSWIVTLTHAGADHEVFLIVAVDRTQFDRSIASFSRNVTISMAILGAFLVLASWFQVRIGLRPLEKIRSEVNTVKQQRGSRLSAAHPSELVPLVDEVNDLLDHQDDTIDQARARASNLAHGLKTPLTIMRALSLDLKRAGQPSMSSDLDAQVDNMQHFVERELARTRDQTTRDSWCIAAPVVERLVLAFQRRAAGREIKWRIDVAVDAQCPFDEYALTELLGNLIDNASKWTRDEITITISGTRDAGFIAVADNGPGILANDLEAVLKRGKRLDETVPGQGLGLTIVADMAQSRGARLDLSNRATGGLSATVSWGEPPGRGALGAPPASAAGPGPAP